MTGLPADGTVVKIWPMPDRRVQDGPRTLDAGGRWLKGPKEIVWSPFYLEQLRAGDILLHDPTPADAVIPAPEETHKAHKAHEKTAHEKPHHGWKGDE